MIAAHSIMQWIIILETFRINIGSALKKIFRNVVVTMVASFM